MDKNYHVINLRVPKDTLEFIDEWRRVQKLIPSRADAARQFLNVGIEAEKAKTAEA